MMLEASGYHVLEADDGASALNAASHTPSAVVTVIRMPGTVSAADVCCYFHQRGIPVIALTGLAHESEEVQRVQEHCAKVLTKPLSPETFLEELRRVIAAEQRADGVS